MQDIPEETKRHVKDLTDEALIGLVKRDAAGYRPDVIAFAQAELDRRGLTHASVRAARPPTKPAIPELVAPSGEWGFVRFVGWGLRGLGVVGFVMSARSTGRAAVVGMVVSALAFIAGIVIVAWRPYSLRTQQPPDPPQR